LRPLKHHAATASLAFQTPVVLSSLLAVAQSSFAAFARLGSVLQVKHETI